MASVALPIVALATSRDRVFFSTGSTLHSLHAASLEGSSAPAAETSSQPHASSLIRQIAISADETHLATYSDDKSLRVYSTNPLKLLSTRQTGKKCSDISFSPSGDIVVSDKVGDSYRYPLEPRPASEKRPTTTELASDPSKNPDADILLGHVSTLTAHTFSLDGKRIITADRDEHIRVSRYPLSYVIDKYLFGSNGFVSALHVPESRPELLISGGGENSLRIWDWQAGRQVGSVGIWEAVLPHRKARSTMRRNKKAKKVKVEDGDAQPGDGFYDAPEGWLLPSGQGVCIKKIRSTVVDGKTVVLFFSEGAAAIHAFTLSSDLSVPPSISTLPFSHPVLDFTFMPASTDELAVSVDTAFEVLTHNQIGQEAKKADLSLTEEQVINMRQRVFGAKIGPDGSLSLSDSPIISSIVESSSSTSNLVTAKMIAGLQLYPNLSLLPRWPGFEEDEEMAGTNDQPEDSPAGPSTLSPIIVAQSEAGTSGFALKKDWTREELETLGPRQLGRLKSQGINIGDLLSRKRLKRVARENKEKNGETSTQSPDTANIEGGKKKPKTQKKIDKREARKAESAQLHVDEEDAMNQ